jgi:hypothetical protein
MTEALDEELLDYDLIQSPPGIGTKIAATIFAEIEPMMRRCSCCNPSSVVTFHNLHVHF